MHDGAVFIAYVESDSSVALSVAAELRKFGYATWTYEEEGLAGFSYLEQVHAAIQTCSAFVLLASKDSLQSHQVRREAETAYEHQKLIIPVRLHISHDELMAAALFRMVSGTAVSIWTDGANIERLSARIAESLRQAGSQGAISGDAGNDARVPMRHRVPKPSPADVFPRRGAAHVDRARDTMPPRPIRRHQTGWQRLDALLIAAGVAGAALFSVLFLQTSLGARIPVAFDASALRQIVQQHALRLNVMITGEAESDARAYVTEYWYLLQRAGTAETHRLAQDVIPLIVWRLRYSDGPSFVIDARGRLVSFSRNSQSFSDVAPLPREEARARATAALGDFFRVSPDALELEREGTLGGRTTVSWKDPQAPLGLTRRYQVILEGPQIESLSNEFQFPPGLALPLLAMETWYTPVSLAVILLLAAIGVRQRDRVAVTTRWRVVFTVAVFLAAFAEGWGYIAYNLEPGSRAAVALGVGFTAATLWLFMSVAVEDRIDRVHSGAMATVSMLFHKDVLTPACGLSVLRGAVLGLTLLGLDAVLVWMVVTRLGGLPDPDMFLWFLGLGLEYPSLIVPLAGAIIQTLWIGAFVAFATSAVMLYAQRRSIVVAIAALVLTLIGAHFSMAAVQPYYWTMAVLLVDYIVLVTIFRRYDLLTLLTAIFTFAFVWGTYMMYIALEPSGAGWPATGLLAWALAIAAAAGVALRHHVTTAFRSIAEALD